MRMRMIGRPFVPPAARLLATALSLSLACGVSNAASFIHPRRTRSEPPAASVRAAPMPASVIDGSTDDGVGRWRGGWISLVGDGDASSSPVRKLVLISGRRRSDDDDEDDDNDAPSDGCTVELAYTGTLSGAPADDWSVDDVVECWLPSLQGMAGLKPKFVECHVDGRALADLTEEYCLSTLGIEGKMQAKKLVMASRRLARHREDHPPGTVFDSSDARGRNYAFVLGPTSKVIRAMDIAARSMRVGERCLLVCRSDYGYGSEGLRTTGGGVVVPPFATLCFDLTLVSISTATSS